MKIIKGKSFTHFKPIIGVASQTHLPFYKRSNTILLTPKLGFDTLGYIGCLTLNAYPSFFQPDIIQCNNFENIKEGDILRLTDDGLISIIWEQDSQDNVIFLTDACDCSCLMCPQPPKTHNPDTLIECERILDLLDGKSINQICFTGGEPTLLKDNFVNLLMRCSNEHPNAIIDILTNGKSFSDNEFAKDVVSHSSNKTVFCVSLHSDVPELHDIIVGKHGSYEKTQMGIYNLAELGAKIEIRHVITKINFNRLSRFAEHIYNYFPFCFHYALMGMELCGYAEINFDKIYIDPSDYIDELADAVIEMNRRDLPVSVYNIPLCLCDKRIRGFARQSISKWKNIYLPQCELCTGKNACAGFFATSTSLPENRIHPLTLEDWSTAR